MAHVTFIEAVNKRDESIENIDAWVEKWHLSENQSLQLHEFLGMTKEQYAEWLINPDVVYTLVDREPTAFKL
jgi:hypothetical protein